MPSKGHDTIMRLRREFDIPEPKDTRTKQEKERDRAEALAREKRIDRISTIEEYVKVYNRDYWTDRWLGPGPDPGLQYLDESKKEIESRLKREQAEWKSKYYPDQKLVNMKIDKKEIKEVKKKKKKYKTLEEKAEWQRKIDIAYWWLECFLKPHFSDELYRKFGSDFEGLVEYCSDYAEQWAKNMTWNDDDPNRHMTAEEFWDRYETQEMENAEIVNDVGGMKFRNLDVAYKHRKYIEVDLTVDPFPDIPDYLWDEFDKWADKHPLKEFKKKAKKTGFSERGLRRKKFLKKVNKRNKGFQKRMMLHDPISGASFVSEKKMKAHYHKMLTRFDKHQKEFNDMIESMVASGDLASCDADAILTNNEDGRKRVAWRHKKEMEKYKFQKKKAEELEKRAKRQQKEYLKARETWFKKFKGDPQACFTIDVDGQEVSFSNIADPGERPIYKIDYTGGTIYTESLDNLKL